MRAAQQPHGRSSWSIALTVLLGFVPLQPAHSQSPDSFNPGPNYWVSPVVVQTDGRIIFGGGFTYVGGQSRGRVARVNASGALDATFANPGADDDVYSLALQLDGKVLVGGEFTLLGNQTRRALGRLNTNGTLDTTFSTTAFNPPPNQTVAYRAQAILLQPDGKIVVGGRSTTTLINNQVITAGFVLRLITNGTSDSGFSTGGVGGGPVSVLAMQSDGKILLGGQFSSVGGQARTRIARLNSNGSLDTNFNPVIGGSIGYGVTSVAIQADRKIIVVGFFDSVAGQPRTNLARISSDGTLDTDFNPGLGNSSSFVYALAVQTDGKILIGGIFSVLGGSQRMRVGRLNSDGSVDPSFNPGANLDVYGLAVQPDGKTLVTGFFSQLGGQSRSSIGRLDSTDPATQSLSYSNSTITWMRGGASPEVWRTTFEASTNLTSWSFLGAGTQIAGGWELAGVALVSGERVRARGYATGGGFNASTWFVETISGPCFFLSQPVGRTNNAGTNATFAVLAGGSPPLSYQWLKNGTPMQDGGQVSGAQTPTLRLDTVFGADAGGYLVIVSNSFGSVTSSVATLKVVDPLISNHPTSLTNNVGTSAAFSVTAQGTAPLSYQWRKDSLNLEDGGNISGAHSATLTLTNVTGANAGYYSVRLTNLFGAVTSVSVRLTVVDPLILSQPTSQSAPPGQTAEFSVTAIGTAPLTYQWRQNGATLAGQTSAAITVTNLQCRDGGGYDVIISNGFSSVTSAVAYLTVDANLATTDSWNPGAGNVVYSQVVRTDGRVLVGGGPFSHLGGQPRNYIGLINADGTLATNFNPNVNDYVYSMLIQTDGRIVLGGHFSMVGGQPRQRLARLNADGSLDTGFNPGASDPIYMPRIKCLAQQSDGKLLVGGVFSTLSGEPHQNIGRLNTNGTVDSTFTQWADWVSSIIVQPDGKILVGARSSLKRLNPDGTLDGGFQAIYGNDSINAVALQSDGKILVGGVFTNLSGQARKNIGRLNPDGSLDLSFNPSANDLVASLAVQCDGKILVSGYFTNLCGQSRRYLGRLHADGTLDCTFNQGVSDSTLPVVYSLLTQPDGKILLGGYFGSIGGQPRSSIGRLNNTEPATEHLSFDSRILTWLRNGTSPEVCRTTFEASTNGTDWTLLGTGTRIPGGWAVDGVSLLANAIVRARGFVQGSGNYSGGGGSSSWFAESTLAVDANLPPKILTSDGSFGFRTNQFGFNVSGLIGQAVVVEVSTNLIQWTPIHTNLIGDPGVFLFRDLESGVYPRRFYRARLQ